VEADTGLQEETSVIHHVLTQMSRYQEDRQQNMGQKWKLPPNGQPICLFSGNNNISTTRTIIRMDDDSEYELITCFFFISIQIYRIMEALCIENCINITPSYLYNFYPICLTLNVIFYYSLYFIYSMWTLAVIFRVYCADHTFCTLRFPIYTTAEMIKICAADKLQITANRGPEDLVLVEVKSNGERTIFKDQDLSIPTALSLNGRIFISPKDHLDALTPLPEQEAITDGIELDVETLATKDLAYHMTLFDWDLFWAVHEYELLYHTFGRHHFNKVSQALTLNKNNHYVASYMGCEKGLTVV
jgi:hypothetical protein